MLAHDFQGAVKDTDALSRRIWRILENRHALHIGELSLRLGLPKDTVHAELDTMIARGELERLHPWNYDGDDQDFVRLCRPGTCVDAEVEQSRRPEYRGSGRERVALAREAMACV